ncbi:outer membrane protein assembly factor BamD [Telluria aromaticivorans]|uniref:Outer membrane protein assembly factor BamD n=1 Tax=Telluria aromaticivorans TaxID=2725995 RepID=A0A7Y2K4Y8_9BURK|nr:outer membrane protein assembly factor BamD [Telluria aromaticivorans]NNG25519.1 outer membrane protein assembly factor BamD [Telluria aromaticivorans]
MQKKLSVLVAACAFVGLSACSMLPERSDDTKNWSAEKLYAEARDEMNGGHYEAAIKLFERLESNYPFGTYAAQAQMEIAYAHYKAQDQAEALAAVERFIKLHPNHPQVDYMYYLRGLVNFNDQLGFLSFVYSQDPTERDPKATREAFAAFKVLVDKFPNSKYAPDAISRMNYLVNAMAQYEVHVANYYYRRGAYLASLNRAQAAVKDYSDAPAREEALFLMIRAYDKLGMPVLRDDAQRVFVANYPNSRFLNPNAVGDAPWWKFWSKSGPKPSPKDAL